MDAYLARLERDMASGALHLLLLGLVARHAPIHGYALIRALTETTGEQVQFKPGTIYPILNDLERMGIVRSTWVASESGPQRKAYALTATGREALAAAAASWGRIRDGVDATLEGGKR